MTVLANDSKIPKTSAINWDNVRPVYKKLQDDFQLITEPFNIELSSDDNLNLSHLIAAIESIDRTLDNLPTRHQRASFATALLTYLKGEEDEISSIVATDEIRWRMKNLRGILNSLQITDEFCNTASLVFKHTEEKRWVKSVAELTYHLREEWRLAGHMTVLVMDGKATPGFKSFFYLCCEMMTAVDMIKDAKSDFLSKQISVRPGCCLYTKLFCEFVLPLPKLLSRFPKPTNLFRYAFGFLKHVYLTDRNDAKK